MTSKGANLDRSLALIIAATKTRKRPVSIAEVSAAIEYAERTLSSINELADMVGVSTKMLRQFKMYNQLSDKAKSLTRNRKIDSVDAVAHIARLNPKDQDDVADKLASQEWDTSDIRAYHEIRLARPDASSSELIAQIQNSKTIQEFVFEFIRRQGISESSVVEKIGAYIDRREIVDVSFSGTKGKLVLSRLGQDGLKDVATKMNIPLKDIVGYLLFQK